MVVQTATAQTIELAAEQVRTGALVVFPTDTVYGVGCDVFQAEAILALYRVKQRPLSKGLPILISDLEQLSRVTTAQLSPLMTDYWPGALTLIVPRHPDLPEVISPNENVAVRIPDCAVARGLIRAAGGAMATSSANLSGLPPAQSASEAVAMLGDEVAFILDDGVSPGGVASTIIDCTVLPFRTLREGPIQLEQLRGIA